MSKSAKTNNVTAAMYDTLVRPVITEKSMLSSEAGKVTFLVPLSASKDEVKAAVELNRQEYGKAYAEYVSEFSDGNIQIDENDDEPYDDNDFEEIETE